LCTTHPIEQGAFRIGSETHLRLMRCAGLPTGRRGIHFLPFF
jgi:hypothetical protein